MGTRKQPAPPPAGPTCPGCQRLAVDLKKMESWQRKQAADLRKLEALLRAQAAELATEQERSRKLEAALHWQYFIQPYMLHQFSQHLPQGNALIAGLTHFN